MNGHKDTDQNTRYTSTLMGRFQGTHLFISAIAIALMLLSTTASYAAKTSLDFGWGSPILLNKKIHKKNKKNYLVWPIQISNPTGRQWLAQLDIVAVTDTGKQYSPISDLKVSVPGEINTLSGLKSNIFPAVTRRALAVFEEVDPNATSVHFYVGGILGVGPNGEEEIQYFRITYKRSLSGWKWDGSSVLE